MKKKFVFAFNLFIILSYIFPLLLSKSNNELANQHYDNYNESTIISLSSVEENIFNNKDNSQIQLDNNRKFDSSQKLLSGIFETSNRQDFVIDAPSKLVFFSEESNDIIDVILKNNLMDYKMEEIVNNTFFLNYTNITLINHHCRNILNITNNETINYTLIDNLLHKFVIHKKGLEAKKAFRNSDGQNNNTLEYSYIFLINTKILYYNYQIYSREFTDNRIYFWDIRLEDMMADTEFLNSTEFNRTEAIAVINTFSSKYNLMKNDYNQIDFTIRNLVQSNYENEMFNRTGLSAEEKDLIMKMIQMKRNYKNFLLQKRLKELEYLESHIGMEMIVNDTLYVRKINLTEWNRIEQIGRKFTNNSNLSEKVNWREFDRIFAKYKSNYIDSENIVNDEYYMGFKEIALFERDYYVWRKNKIENPVSPKKVKSQITNPASDSLFTDIGKNIHDSLQPLALAKISEKRIRDKEESVVCSRTCVDECEKNYISELDKSKCKVVTCECYMTENWNDLENISGTILTTKEYFKNGFLKTSIFILIVLLIYMIFSEIVKRNSENVDLDHYHRMSDEEHPFPNTHHSEYSARF